MATFVPVPGIALMVAKSPMVRTMLAAKAARVAAVARSNGAGVRRSGHYASAFATQLELRPRGWEAHVVNSDFKAGWIEFGTRNNPRHRCLGRALDAAR